MFVNMFTMSLKELDLMKKNFNLNVKNHPSKANSAILTEDKCTSLMTGV